MAKKATMLTICLSDLLFIVGLDLIFRTGNGKKQVDGLEKASGDIFEEREGVI